MSNGTLLVATVGQAVIRSADEVGPGIAWAWARIWSSTRSLDP